MEHSFTPVIVRLLIEELGDDGPTVFAVSPLLQYLNIKTQSASLGSKSRGSFANHYALYTLVEDYIQKGFVDSGQYADYEGAVFSELLKRVRQLPFGSKLQNHALNNRLNGEFRKLSRQNDIVPIVHDLETQRYWINEQLLTVKVKNRDYNIAKVVLKIIEAYVATKKGMFEQFVESCKQIALLKNESGKQAESFIIGLLAPNTDARIFEIVSYAILKVFYSDQKIFWGYDTKCLSTEHLTLFKTGRTNANDGGIDYVMRPLGRFFQVTETTDVKKYFLDINKVLHYPVTFVVKSTDSPDNLRRTIQTRAEKYFSVKIPVKKMMNCIEEIITIPILLERLGEVVRRNQLKEIVHEIVRQSSIEFNMETFLEKK